MKFGHYQVHAKSMCIIAARISLESTEKPISGSTTMDATKPRAFSPSELVQCVTCSRTNPPTRASCLYCGSALEITELNRFSPAAIQEAEKSSGSSFHVVACGAAHVEETRLEGLAGLLDRKPSELKSLLAHPAGAAVFTVNSEKQALVIARKLSEQGVLTRVISDEQLAPERPPAAISALEISDDAVVGSVGRGNQTVFAPWTDITLVVSGRLYFETSEIAQTRNRAKQVIDEREISTDEAVLDVYARGNEEGWRIRAGGFDFSCLGEHKKLTTFENFAALTSLLREQATAAVFDDSYVRLRRALDSVWPNEPGVSARARRRTAFGNFDLSATSINNELQFTRYSRLRRLLHASKSEDHVA